MRIELSQYNDLAAFAQFGSDLDPATAAQLERGKRTIEILKQPQYEPLSEALQYLSIWAVSNGKLDDIPVDQVQKFEKDYHNFITRNHKKIIEGLSTGKKPTDDFLKDLDKATSEFKKTYKY